jgi:hypothetical protein
VRGGRWLLAAAVLAVVACGSPPPTGSSVSASEGGATTPRSSGSGSGTASPTPLVQGIPVIAVSGPPSTGADGAPRFTWSRVDGAAEYRLVILGPDGKPLWAWSGADTSVVLWNLPEPQKSLAFAPTIAPGSTWTVAAVDATGRVLAASARQSVSP